MSEFTVSFSLLDLALIGVCLAAIVALIAMTRLANQVRRAISDVHPRVASALDRMDEVSDQASELTSDLDQLRDSVHVARAAVSGAGAAYRAWKHHQQADSTA